MTAVVLVQEKAPTSVVLVHTLSGVTVVTPPQAPPTLVILTPGGGGVDLGDTLSGQVLFNKDGAIGGSDKLTFNPTSASGAGHFSVSAVTGFAGYAGFMGGMGVLGYPIEMISFDFMRAAALVCNGIGLLDIQAMNVAPGAYSLANSGIVVTDYAGAEIFRIWGTDPNAAVNYNSQNLYIGFEAGKNQPIDNVDAGYCNIGIGGAVLANITTGSNNIAIGTGVMNLSSTALMEVALGWNTLAHSNGMMNVSIGALSLFGLTTGFLNTALGAMTLAGLVDGTHNVAVGCGAGVGMVFGKAVLEQLRIGQPIPLAPEDMQSVHDMQMTFVGALSSRAEGIPLDPMTNAIAIGYDTKVAASNTAVIGNANVTDVYFGSAAGHANISAKSVIAKGENSLVLSGSAAGAPVTIEAIGADTDVAIHMKPKNRPVNFGPDLATGFNTYNVSQATVRNTNATGRAHTYELVVTTVGSDAVGAQTTSIYCTTDSGVGALNNPSATVAGTFTGYSGAPVGRTLNRLIGIDSQTSFRGAGTVNESMGLRAKAWNVGPGVITNMYGVGSYVNNYSTGTVVNAFGVGIFSGTNTGGGVLTNLYGLIIDNQTAGVNNWALKTGLGKVEFGDTLLCQNVGVAGSIEVAGGIAVVGGAYFLGDVTFSGAIIYGAPVVDGTASGPVTSDYNAGYTTAVGDLMYLDVAGTWQKCDANASYDGMPGIALEVKTAGQAVRVALPGSTVWVSARFPTFIVGAPVYMSETAGDVTQTKPPTPDSATRVMGWATHADQFYFFPQSDYVVHI